MEYIRIFNNDSEYQQFKDGDDYITPNICLDREINGIKCKPYTPPVVLITFTINGTEYQAEEGMIWVDWCDSKYNSIGLYATDGISYNSLLQNAYGMLYSVTQNNVVRPSEKINKEDIYYLTQSGGGGS